jgi:hypothetical protein
MLTQKDYNIIKEGLDELLSQRNTEDMDQGYGNAVIDRAYETLKDNLYIEANTDLPPKVKEEWLMIDTLEKQVQYSPKLRTDQLWHGKDMQNGYWWDIDIDNGIFVPNRIYRRLVKS